MPILDFLAAVRHNLRSSRTNAALVVLTLSLGMAATTLVFSLLDTMLLRPLPYPGADRIQFLWTVANKSKQTDELTTPARWRDLRDQSTTIEALGAFYTENLNLTSLPQSNLDAPERVLSVRYLPGFFASLGITPQLGQLTTTEEETAKGPRAILITHDFWLRRLAASPAVLNQNIHLNAATYRIAGILPKGFRFPVSGASFFVPAQLDNGLFQYRSARFLQLIVRRKPGIAPEAVSADITRVLQSLGTKYGTEESAFSFRLEDPRAYFIERSTTRAIWLLSAAVGLLLLIACANAANLLIARGASRQRQHAVSLALGASPLRLTLETITEGLFLSLLAALVGAAFTSWGLTLVSKYWTTLPTFRELEIDWRIAAFSLAIAATSGIAASLVPGWQAARQNAMDSLRVSTSAASTGGRGTLRRALVSLQIGLCFLLLASAWTLGEQLQTLLKSSPGFRASNILTFQVTLPWETPREQMDSLFTTLRSTLTTGQQISRVAYSEAMPFEDRIPTRHRSESQSEIRATRTVSVSPSFFDILGIPLLSGRDFTTKDTPAAAKVVILNQSAANLYFPGTNPIGKKLLYPWANNTEIPQLVIGVVADTRANLAQGPVPTVYQTFQLGTWPSPTYFIETKSAPLSAVAECRQILKTLAPRQAMHRVQTLENYLTGTVAEPRLSFSLVSLFAGSAALLCFLGLYGVMSWYVASRRSEIGLRSALGAERTHVLTLLLRQGLTPVAVGLLAGFVTFELSLTALDKLLHGLAKSGPLGLTSSALALLLLALAAIALPAWRALSIEPREALTQDVR